LQQSSEQSPEKKPRLDESLSDDDKDEVNDFMQVPEEGKLLSRLRYSDLQQPQPSLLEGL